MLTRSSKILFYLFLHSFVLLSCNVSAASLQSELLKTRIVGGLPATNVNIPYIVSLINNGFHHCGGSIINERTVVTAAHCLAFTTARVLKVHAGAKTRMVGEGEMLSVQAIYSHQEWTMETMDYDIGLVRLMRPLVFSATIQPVRLPEGDYKVRDGSTASVAGWGYMSVFGPGSEMLRYANVPIFNQDRCSRLLGGGVTKRMLCAGYIRGGIDACQMDSGGPLVEQGKLVGIVSWGIGCALPNKPGVYTRVTELRPWLEQIMATEYNEVI